MFWILHIFVYAAFLASVLYKCWIFINGMFHSTSPVEGDWKGKVLCRWSDNFKWTTLLCSSVVMSATRGVGISCQIVHWAEPFDILTPSVEDHYFLSALQEVVDFKRSDQMLSNVYSVVKLFFFLASSQFTHFQLFECVIRVKLSSHLHLLSFTSCCACMHVHISLWS